MPQHHSMQPLKSYRACLIPKNADRTGLEELADSGLLPTIRVKAADTDEAENSAYLVSGKDVLRIERAGVAHA